MEDQKFEAWNQPQPEPQPQYRPDNKKVAAGILAILLGGLGVHKFVLGYTTEGILQIVFSIITCGVAGSLIGLIEGIIYLTKTDEEFYQMYQVNKKGWF
jgi:TM2 domain-containing membrane protein YozV